MGSGLWPCAAEGAPFLYGFWASTHRASRRQRDALRDDLRAPVERQQLFKSRIAGPQHLAIGGRDDEGIDGIGSEGGAASCPGRRGATKTGKDRRGGRSVAEVSHDRKAGWKPRDRRALRKCDLQLFLVPKLQRGHALVREALLRKRGLNCKRALPVQARGSRASKTSA